MIFSFLLVRISARRLFNHTGILIGNLSGSDGLEYLIDYRSVSKVSEYTL